MRRWALAALLRFLPISRVAAANGLAAPSPMVALFRTALGAAAVAGSLHAASGASITIRQPANSAVRATNGVPSAFRLDVQYSDGDVTLTPELYVAPNLPPGFNPPSLSGPVWRITGTPTQSGVFRDVRVTAYKFSPVEAPNQESATFPVTITVVDGKPVIVRQPKSITVALGGRATFSVEATGGNLSYRWRKDDLELPGATEPMLTLNSVGLSDAGAYQVFVQNSGGGALSDVAELVVTPGSEPPVFTAVPTNAAVHIGESVRLTSAAEGAGPLIYQWFQSGQPLADQTQPALFVNAAQPADAGSYTVAVTGSGGTTVSPPAVVSVAPALRVEAITLQGDSIRISFNGIIGRTYVLWGTTDLIAGGWTPVAATAGTEVSSFLSPVTGEVQAFRIEAPLAP